MKKYIYAIGIIVLFIISALTPIVFGYNIKILDIEKQTPLLLNRGETLYVGGSGPGNYSKIQDSINDSLDGDTVFVFNDSSPYYEHIVVNKSINLIGEDKNSTVIDGNGTGDVIYIISNQSNISGFTIQNSGNSSWPTYDCGIELRSNNNTIINNIFSNNDNGIYLYYANNNLITRNKISSVLVDTIGLILNYSNFNIISDNFIHHNYHGIEFQHSNDNIIITCNLISNNNSGVRLRYSSFNNLVYHNNFINNTWGTYSNAYDECNNNWSSTSLQEGNYWDDYNGTDANKDGIGDNPYPVLGGDSKDYYPLMTQYGPPHAEYNYVTDDKSILFNASLSYDYNGIITSYEWNFGDGEVGTGMIIYHTYPGYNIYNVTLNITDNDGLTDNISKDVIVVDENPPTITDLKAIPPLQIPGGYVNISALVIDNVELSDVRLVLRYPDLHWETISILQNKTEYTYYCNSTYNMIGIYNWRIWAIDTSGNNANSTLKDFEITGEFVVDAGGPYLWTVNIPLMFHGYVVNGNPPYSWHWDFGDGYTSSEQNPVHTYKNIDNYTVTLTVTDNNSNIVNDTTWTLIRELLNEPPDAPLINGPTSGAKNKIYSYAFVAADSNGDNIYYQILWGDGTAEEWLGPYQPDVAIVVNHTWSDIGRYTIMARAKDEHDAIGDWSTLNVIMPRNKISTNSLFLKLFEQFPNLFLILQTLLLRIRL